MLQESRHFGVFIYGGLDGEEAPVQLVDQAHVDDIAARKTQKEKKNMLWLIVLFVNVKTIYHG